MSFWDGEIGDKRVKLLRQLWADGLNASQIASRLGQTTRNAVIGKIHRLGLSTRGNGSRASVVRKKYKRAAPAYRRASKPKNRVREALSLPREPLPPRQETDIARVSFADLESHHCRFIPDDPSASPALYATKFCGLPIVAPGLSYCRAHLERCHSHHPLAGRPRASARVTANARRQTSTRLNLKGADHTYVANLLDLELAE